MLTIDLIDWRQDVVARIGDDIANGSIIGEAGGVLLILGIILAFGFELRRWMKKKGYRMVLKDRNDKIHALLTDILGDGIEDAVGDGKISRQEARRLYRDLQHRLGLNDLVPKKVLANEVKTRLRSAKVLREKARANGGEHKPNIPGGAPAPVKREPFAQRMGRAKFN